VYAIVHLGPQFVFHILATSEETVHKLAGEQIDLSKKDAFRCVLGDTPVELNAGDDPQRSQGEAAQ